MKTNGKKRALNFCVISAFTTLFVSSAFAALDEPEGITERETKSCPLNSGGPSLLGSKWRVAETYGTVIPELVTISMTVNMDTMAGETGCNKYAAKFKQIGATGFAISDIVRTREPCMIVRPGEGKPTIHLGNIEGSYLRIMRRMGSVEQVDSSTLVFYDRNGKKGLVMNKL